MYRAALLYSPNLREGVFSETLTATVLLPRLYEGVPTPLPAGPKEALRVALNGGVGAAPDGFAVLRLEVCSSTGPFFLPEGYAYTSPSTERTGFVRGEEPVAPVRYPLHRTGY